MGKGGKFKGVKAGGFGVFFPLRIEPIYEVRDVRVQFLRGRGTM